VRSWCTRRRAPPSSASPPPTRMCPRVRAGGAAAGGAARRRRYSAVLGPVTHGRNSTLCFFVARRLTLRRQVRYLAGLPGDDGGNDPAGLRGASWPWGVTRAVARPYGPRHATGLGARYPPPGRRLTEPGRQHDRAGGRLRPAAAVHGEARHIWCAGLRHGGWD
jgi:hypothetical protein